MRCVRKAPATRRWPLRYSRSTSRSSKLASANAQRELEQQSGAEFDRTYVGMQIGMHMQLESVLSVLKNHVQSPELRKAIDDESQLVSRHFEQAKKLAKDLESNQRGNNNSSTNSSR